MQLSEVLGVSSRQIERLTVAGVLKPVRCKANGRARTPGRLDASAARNDRRQARARVHRVAASLYG
jgi:hypothetical protein